MAVSLNRALRGARPDLHPLTHHNSSGRTPTHRIRRHAPDSSSSPLARAAREPRPDHEPDAPDGPRVALPLPRLHVGLAGPGPAVAPDRPPPDGQQRRREGVCVRGASDPRSDRRLRVRGGVARWEGPPMSSCSCRATRSGEMLTLARCIPLTTFPLTASPRIAPGGSKQHSLRRGRHQGGRHGVRYSLPSATSTSPQGHA
jgi:hypothetical protein